MGPLATILLFLAASGRVEGHATLYSPCLTDQEKYDSGNEITPGPSGVTSLVECDASCIADASCTYFTYNHVINACRWFSGDFSLAPTMAEQLVVSGVAGCTDHMNPSDINVCNEASPSVTNTFGPCVTSSLGADCGLPEVQLPTCTWCGMDVDSKYCSHTAQYSICIDHPYTLQNYPGKTVLSLTCDTSVCTDITVLIESLITPDQDTGFFAVFDDNPIEENICGGHYSFCEYYTYFSDDGIMEPPLVSVDDDTFYVVLFDASSNAFQVPFKIPSMPAGVSSIQCMNPPSGTGRRSGNIENELRRFVKGNPLGRTMNKMNKIKK